MPEYNSNRDALNDIVADYGLSGGHHFEIDALNAWAVHLGGVGGHQFNIDALNEIIGLVAGSGSFEFEIDAYNEISRALGGRSDFQFVEDALSEISDLPVYSGGGGGGALEALADANFSAGTYTVGATSYSVTDLFAGDAVVAGTVFDPADIVPDSGLKGSQEGGTSIPSMIGALKTTVLGTDGSAVVFDFTIDDTSPNQCLNLDVSDISDFAPSNIAILINPQDGQSPFDGGFTQVDAESTQTATVNFSGLNVVASYGAHKLGIRCSRDGLAVAIDGVASSVVVPDPLITWGDLTGVAIYRNGYKYLSRIRVYAKDADLASLTALS